MNPVLYIITRNDLDSMNPGKLAAQCSHASNAFVYAYRELIQQSSVNQTDDKTAKIHKAFNQWQNQTTQGFGTVLVLEGLMPDITNTIGTMSSWGYLADVIHDPTYPIVDGSVVHHIPLDTCAYVFVPDKDTDIVASAELSKFKLHR